MIKDKITGVQTETIQIQVFTEICTIGRSFGDGNIRTGYKNKGNYTLLIKTAEKPVLL